MDRSNVWDLVKGNEEKKTQIPALPHVDTSHILNVEAMADATELPAEALSEILGEMARERSEKKLSKIGKSPILDSVRRFSKRMRSRASRSASRSVERKFGRDLETAEKSSLPEVPIASASGFVVIESVTEKPLTLSVENAVERANTEYQQIPFDVDCLDPQNTEEKCAYLFRGDSLYMPTAKSTDKVERVHVYDPFCPLHGSRRCISRRMRLADVGGYHVTSIESVDDTEPTGVILLSQAYAAKLIRKRKRALLSGDEKRRNDKAKRKIITNLWIVSLTFLFLFTAFHGLQNLQTSVNGQLGADSLCAFYMSLSISYLFVPSFILNRLGCKRTLICSSGIYMIYMLSNFLPKYYSLIPVSILAGCAGSCLWAAKCVYILESGIRYAHLNVEAQNVVIIRFFGYFFMVLHLGQVIGNLISSRILTAAMGYHKPVDRVEQGCGHLFSNNESLLSEQAIKNLQRPSQGAYLSVCGVYFCCTIVALMIVLLFLNSLKKDQIARMKAPHYSSDIFQTVLRNLLRPKPLLLVPLTFFSGIEQAFVVGLYTKAYVGCGLGISQIGSVMTSFGVTDAICSLVFGPLMKLFGRMPLFVFGAVINMLMIMTLLIWPLNPGDTSLFYAIAGVWGMADGVWNTQINGFWVALSGSNLEASFANYRFWESFGFAFGLLLTRFTNISQFLHVSLAALLIGIIGYAGVEFYDDLYAYFSKLFGVCCLIRYCDRHQQSSMEASLISSRKMPVIQLSSTDEKNGIQLRCKQKI